ncbi:XRE family transcriptional regulator [Kineococcus sp. R8]|nr:XRE family transcriptional regulator [Kineococcus siccus]
MPRTLAEKVDLLFRTVHPAKGGEYSYEHVAKAIRDRGGPSISGSYLWLLRKGERDNPTLRHLEALAGFFGVPPGYFFDDDLSDSVQDQLALLALLRDGDVRKVALRTSGLSRESLQALGEMVDRVRKLEGLPVDPELGEGPPHP